MKKLSEAIQALESLVDQSRHRAPVYNAVQHEFEHDLYENETTAISCHAATKVIRVQEGLLRVILNEGKISHLIHPGETYEIPANTPHFMIADEKVRYFLWFKPVVTDGKTEEFSRLPQAAAAWNTVKEPVERTGGIGKRAWLRRN